MRLLLHIGWMLCWLLPAVPAQAQDVVVEPGGPVPSLTAALAVVPTGGRIVVRPGVYREPTLVVGRPVTIVGEGEAVLDGEGARQIMTITADDVTVRGLVFRHVGVSYIEDRAAVKVEGARRCVIVDNRFENTFFGIYLAKAAGCRIAGNDLRGLGTSETGSGNGIHLWYCKDITIEHNHIRGHRDGIYIEFAEDSVIRDNLSERNLRYGLHFMFSDRCRYRDNVFRDNDAGVAVMYTDDVVMEGNRFIHNWGSAAYGLLLKEIRDSHITGNTFERNTVGLLAEGVSRVTVEDNTFTRNGWALRVISDSKDNVFRHNDFLANSFDVATNSRVNYSRFEENYWDHYQGYDLDRDGYGDVPFRPVRLFSLLVEHNEPTLILMRSLFISLLDAAERVLPVLTPETLVDERPLMHPRAPAPEPATSGADVRDKPHKEP